jgi:hypothetical protein
MGTGVKRPGREADPAPLSSAEVKNVWRYTSTPNNSSWRGNKLSTGTTYTDPSGSEYDPVWGSCVLGDEPSGIM